MTTLGVIAYEVSADRLGEGLILELKQRHPHLQFEGVVGERLTAAGCLNRMPADGMAVMGLVEVLRHLPELLRKRRELLQHFVATRPALVIGIDAPDFNLGLERRLRAAGIPTVHYVSPTFWAWRQGRVKGLKQSADLVLSIFPFEEAFLRQNDVPVQYVGHPLAWEIPLQSDRQVARGELRMALSGEVVSLLPGSRQGEVSRLIGPFLQAAQWLNRHRPGIRFLLPCPKTSLRPMIETALSQQGQGLDCRILSGDSHRAMAAADVVLTASGTATLETLMHKRPMVVGYRVNWLTYWIAKAMLKVPYIAMANLLAGEGLAPEYVQQECQWDALAHAVAGLLDDQQRCQQIEQRYDQIHRSLRLDSAKLAADAVETLLRSKGVPL